MLRAITARVLGGGTGTGEGLATGAGGTGMGRSDLTGKPEELCPAKLGQRPLRPQRANTPRRVASRRANGDKLAVHVIQAENEGRVWKRLSSRMLRQPSRGSSGGFRVHDGARGACKRDHTRQLPAAAGDRPRGLERSLPAWRSHPLGGRIYCLRLNRSRSAWLEISSSESEARSPLPT